MNHFYFRYPYTSEFKTHEIFSLIKKSKTYNHNVPNDLEARQRLRIYAKGLFPYLETSNAVKKAIQKHQIRLNGNIGRTGDWVTAGNEVSFELTYDIPDQINSDLVEMIYEDHDLIIVRKPPGISSSGNTRSLQQRLQGNHVDDYDGSLPYPYLVHRLDKATEGLLIAAKNIETRRVLASMMDNHSITKDYVCIVEGEVDASLRWITSPIDGKPAKTEIISSDPLSTKDSTTRLFIRLHTGRTHQIRKHFREINHPIVGDIIYNNEGLSFGSGLLLCAYRIEFKHPITHKNVVAEYPIPSKISKYRNVEN